MAVLNQNLPQAWTPEDYGTLIDLVIAEQSIAFQAATKISTTSETWRTPMHTADPAVAWYGENTTIALADPSASELVVTPKKVAGRTQISNEAAQDTNPAAAENTGRSLARSVAKGIDKAFFANTTSGGPSGLLSLTGINVVDTGTYTLTSRDAFIKAKYAARADGAELTHFILALDVAEALELAKENGESNKPLFDDIATLAGVTVLVSPDIAPGNAWGLDSSQVFTVQRTGTTIVKDASAAFAEDAVQVRATARVGFGFANPAGVVRLHDAA
ncbi:capsid protein [Mycobacterium sp. 852013-51886_SCH5428379]|uniref:phage major capsid protein n=1 Tax=Mycobacterium sp. 852013-51886_SCH5428379 TaxID=1834111 RepID=UPI0007FFCC9E|nr:phage major capsid protein [Mycobacterium sp. 852013-51886_SCH5428379]OBB57958.1 capsid protein [Mycobacterium sp. 852013-51886_SCH5428379]